MDGVHRAIERCRAADLRLALASSSSHQIISAVLERLGLEEIFEVIASGSDEVHGKPDPAIYLTTLSRLGLPASECVAFEDSAAGVRAAIAAGCFTIAVPDPVDFADPVFDRAHLKLRSLSDFEQSLIEMM